MKSGTKYFLPEGYRINENPLLCDRLTRKKIDAQWHVYALAKKICNSNIIDVGCGNGEMLMFFFSEANLLGLDLPHNIELCEEKFPKKKWKTINLENPIVFPANYKSIICADVIEHLVYPEWLLKGISSWLDTNDKIAIISTPERIRKRGPNDLGPPQNPHHVREWSRDELASLFWQFNLPAQFIIVPSSRTSKICTTQVAICSRQ